MESVLSRGNKFKWGAAILAAVLMVALVGPAVPSSAADPVGMVTNFSDAAVVSPLAITVGPDGNLWFTMGDNGPSSIGRITPTGGIATFTNATVNTPWAIARCGRAPVVHQQRQQHDRADHALRPDHCIPDANGTINGPMGIAAGPDGALWFTNAGNNSIGRITTGSPPVITNYPGTPGSPQGIARGSDDNMWFTNYPDAIGKITTGVTPTITPYTGASVTTLADRGGSRRCALVHQHRAGRGPQLNWPDHDCRCDHQPHQLDRDRPGQIAWFDANMWFTNGGNGSIGRITTAASPRSPTTA